MNARDMDLFKVGDIILYRGRNEYEVISNSFNFYKLKRGPLEHVVTKERTHGEFKLKSKEKFYLDI